jgi:hypothetical protein
MHLLNNLAVCDSQDRLFERKDLESKKNAINRTLQVLKWLLEAKPAVAGWKGNAEKLRKLHETSVDTVLGMIEGGYWKKQLSGWKEAGCALVALCKMTDGGQIVDFASYVVDRCKSENDDLRKRMHQREVRFLADGEEPPTLESVERRDVSAEAKWTRTLDFLRAHDLHGELEKLIHALDQCLQAEEPPRRVLEILKNLPKPPGYKTLEERQEEERLVRARELAEDEDF